MGNYAQVWEFHIRPEQRDLFERVYGPNGDWAALFRLAFGYVGTVLLRDDSDRARYLTIDRWESREAYEEFGRRFAERYQELDEKCQDLTLQERSLGGFTEVGG